MIFTSQTWNYYLRTFAREGEWKEGEGREGREQGEEGRQGEGKGDGRQQPLGGCVLPVSPS